MFTPPPPPVYQCIVIPISLYFARDFNAWLVQWYRNMKLCWIYEWGMLPCIVHLFHQVLVFFFFFTFSWMEHGPITLIKLPYFQQTAYRLNFYFVHAFFSTVWHWLALSSDVWLGHNLYCINYNKTLAWCAAPKHTSDNKLGQVCLVPDWHCVGKFKIQVGN